MSQQQIISENSSNIPVSQVYWSLVEKADKKFSKISDLPYYERNRYDTYFYKVFKVYTKLWKFQQENRQKLVDAGLKRWEIGEIASQLLSFIMGNLCGQVMQETDFKEWKLVFQEIIKYLKADAVYEYQTYGISMPLSIIKLLQEELDKLSSPLGAGTSINTAENVVRNFQSHNIGLDGASTSPFSSPSNCPNQSSRRSKGDCLYYGARGNEGLNSIYPTDLVPFIRRPLFIVIDSDAVSGAEKGEPAAIAISPLCSISLNAAESSRHQSGSLFTLFLTTPLRAFCLLIGLSGSDIEMDTEIRQKKNECYADIESGLWGQQCKSSMTAKENCALRCFLRLVMSLFTRAIRSKKVRKISFEAKSTSTVCIKQLDSAKGKLEKLSNV
ncbi:hypothetical protein GH714_004377 [Hevea brasiliensis]|uniref:Uncharacterized protein n=1 Tax=Hevea brasiliensis TaxID=3981 RepID=A0A6A6KJM1_HEVBR|nr:hypothetical protein GH714_004377 [Hevea brasiliensis]